VKTAQQDHDQIQGQVDRALAEADREPGGPAELTAEVDTIGDRMRLFSQTGFSRMKLTWAPDEAAVMQRIWAESDRVIEAYFGEAFDILELIYKAVRVPKPGADPGEVMTDAHGRTQWLLDEEGRPVEDWTRLGDKQRDTFLNQLMINLFAWEQTAAKLWGDAMFAKGLWEEKFSSTFFAAPGSRPTEADRTQHGRRSSMQERYFAVFKSMVSRRAEAVVKSMNRVYDRLERDSRR
jgi:hypothetical protein